MADEEQGKAKSIEDRLAIVRIVDVLLGINQACSETAHQLRIAHIYQLQKDRQSLRQKAAASAIFLVTALEIPPIYSEENLKLPIRGADWARD